eukprot:scaffold155383_cov33-Tisochrysis_lutea.AAC.1
MSPFVPTGARAARTITGGGILRFLQFTFHEALVEGHPSFTLTCGSRIYTLLTRTRFRVVLFDVSPRWSFSSSCACFPSVAEASEFNKNI